jgi:membrane associated rhomboid family serine protease
MVGTRASGVLVCWPDPLHFFATTMNVVIEQSHQPRAANEWELPGRIPDKPSDSAYGFMTNWSEVVECSDAEELVSKVIQRGVKRIKFVWTPETPQPVYPETVPWLVIAFQKQAAEDARKAIYWGVGLLTFGVIVALVFNDWQLLYRSFLAVIGALILIAGAYELYRARNYTQEDAESAASSARFGAWLKSKRITGYTFAIAASIVMVGGAQLIAGDKESIDAVGLVKPAVRQGQWWRLFTSTLMHVNFTHFWMNLVALLEFARIVEHTIQRAYMPLVFLFSAVCGSIFSLLLYPNTTSVGASGGLMGLLGFLTVSVFVEREKYPPKYLKRLIESIGFVAVLGIVGFAFIDNAAHLGGLCGGAILGWIFLKRGNTEAGRSSGARLHLMGIISLILIGLSALTAIRQMLK